MKTRQTLTLQLLDRRPALGSQLIPFSDQHWTQTLTMKVGLNWIFLVLFLKVIYAEHEILSMWVDMSERTSGYMCLFLTRTLCILQVSSLRCTWWSLGDALWSLVGAWDSSAASDSPSVVTGCTGSARFQGRGWSRLKLLTLIVRVQTMQTLSWQIHHILKNSQVSNVTAHEQPERWGHSHVLLCKRHSRGTSVRAKT
jgi:hypothetical protein